MPKHKMKPSSIKRLVEAQTAGDLANSASWLAANRYRHNENISNEELVRQVVIKFLIDDYGIELLRED